MRSKFNSNLNGSSNIGIGIFYLILIFVPFLGWAFNLLDWVIDHILLFIGLGVIIFFINVWRDYKSQEEKENV